MGEELREATEQAFLKISKDFMDMKPGSAVYNQQAELILDIRKAQLEEDKLDAERSDAEYRRGSESEKLELEHLAEENRRRNNWIQVALESGKVVVATIATGAFQRRLIKFEETGIARSSAWKFIPVIRSIVK